MKTFEEMLKKFKYSMERIETLPIYQDDIDEQEFKNYKNGIPENCSELCEWHNTIKKALNNAGYIERIRILPNKMNIYLAYEFETGYVQNSLIGEKIYTLSLDEYEKNKEDDNFTAGDYWIFDREHVLQLNYDENGRFLNSTLIEDEQQRLKAINFYIKLRKNAENFQNTLKRLRNRTIDFEE